MNINNGLLRSYILNYVSSMKIFKKLIFLFLLPKYKPLKYTCPNIYINKDHYGKYKN